MRAKSAHINLVLIVSLVLSSMSANVYAEPPTDLGAGLLASAAPTMTPTAQGGNAATDGAANTTELPSTSSLEKVAEIQQLFMDMGKNPFWFAASASIYFGFFVLHKVLTYFVEDIPRIIFLVQALRKTLPADAASSRFFGTLEKDLAQYGDAAKAFAREVKQLERRRRRMMAEIDLSNEAIDPTFRRAIGYTRRRLQEQEATPIEQIGSLRTDKSIRQRFNRSEAGRQWLKRFDKNYDAHLARRASMEEEFDKIHHSITNLSEHINNASQGWIRNDDLRHRPMYVDLKPATAGDVGAMRHFHDAGHFSEVKNPNDLPEMVNTSVINCRDKYAKLGHQREKLRRELIFRGLVKPGLLAGGGASSYLAYRYSSDKIRKQFNAEPTEIVAKQKTDATAQIVKDAVQSTSPIKMQEAIHAWRNNKNNPKAGKLFDVLTTSVKSHLKAMAHDINSLSVGQIDGAAIEERLAQFEKDPGSLEDVVEMALADAASLELKISDPIELEGILLAELKDGPKYLKRDTLLSNQVGLIPKYAWQTLGVTNLPISSTTNSTLLKAMKAEFDRIREEEAAQAAQAAKEAKDAKDAKAGSPSTAGAPTPADQAVPPTSSRVGLEVNPGKSLVQVGGLDENFSPPNPRQSSGRTQSIAVSTQNLTHFAPYAPEASSEHP